MGSLGWEGDWNWEPLGTGNVGGRAIEGWEKGKHIGWDWLGKAERGGGRKRETGSLGGNWDQDSESGWRN